MESNKFDDLIKRAATTRLTRMETLRGLAAGAVAAVTGAAIASTDADAKKGKSAKRGKNAKKGKSQKGNVKGTTTTKAPKTTTTEAPKTTTTEAPYTTTTPKCLPNGTVVYKKDKYDCCNGYCEDKKGEYTCGSCTTTTTESPKTTTTPKGTTTTPKDCIPNNTSCKEEDKDKCCSGCWDREKRMCKSKEWCKS